MKKRVMIVDDETDMLTVTITRLESAGYDVLKAVSAEEALKVLEKDIPDLMLLDLLLPKMQGDILCKRLKSDPKFKDMPILLFTASIIRIPDKVKEIGADDYILKPFEPEDLLFKIKKFIG